jgi:uncharacterized protein YqgC (DUF456 family)
MELAVIILGIVLIFVGFAGSILPALPGPPIAYVALLLLFFHPEAAAVLAANDYVWLIVLGIVTLVVAVIDYYMPIWGTKKFGGTPAGSRGSTIGLVVALLLAIFTGGIGAFGILLGPLVGAYLGEKYAGQNNEVAMQSAKGSFLGFISGVFMKVVMVLVIAVYFASVLL